MKTTYVFLLGGLLLAPAMSSFAQQMLRAMDVDELRQALAANHSASAQQALPPDIFKDVEKGHWAYAAMDSLCAAGVVRGYPTGYFMPSERQYPGRQTLTRYEFAVAIDRALKSAFPRRSPENVATLRRLTAEFKEELLALGWTSGRIERRLDQIGNTFIGRSEPFKDVPTNHWAYQSVEDLRKKGILIGYPDGSFHGESTPAHTRSTQ